MCVSASDVHAVDNTSVRVLLYTLSLQHCSTAATVQQVEDKGND